jgi:hypothetical protein
MQEGVLYDWQDLQKEVPLIGQICSESMSLGWFDLQKLLSMIV